MPGAGRSHSSRTAGGTTTPHILQARGHVADDVPLPEQDQEAQDQNGHVENIVRLKQNNSADAGRFMLDLKFIISLFLVKQED